MKTNYSSRRSQSTMMNDLKNAVTELKNCISKPTPVLFMVKPWRNAHKFESSLMSALIELNYVSVHQPEKGSAYRSGQAKAYQWTWGVDQIDYEKIYGTYLHKENVRKSGNQMKPMVVKPKVDLPKQVKTDVNNSSKSKRVKMFKVDSVKPKENPIKEVKGTIFGYKQLLFMREIFRSKPTTVLVDDRFTLENVELITFTIDKSKLTMSFYMFSDKQTHEPDKGSLIGTLNMDNIVLAFREAFEDNVSKSLKIYTIPVKNPYDLQEL